MRKNQLRKGALVERLHVNEHLIIMKPPQRGRPHFTCPILPVPELEQASRMKRTCAGEHSDLGEYGTQAQCPAQCRAACTGAGAPARTQHTPHATLTFPVIPPSLPAAAQQSAFVFSCLKTVPAPPHLQNTGGETGTGFRWLICSSERHSQEGRCDSLPTKKEPNQQV